MGFRASSAATWQHYRWPATTLAFDTTTGQPSPSGGSSLTVQAGSIYFDPVGRIGYLKFGGASTSYGSGRTALSGVVVPFPAASVPAFAGADSFGPFTSTGATLSISVGQAGVALAYQYLGSGIANVTAPAQSDFFFLDT